MKDLSGEGVEDMGDGGAKLPPSPRNSLPSPCTIPMATSVSPSRGRCKGWGFESNPPFFRNLLGIPIPLEHVEGDPRVQSGPMEAR